MRVTAQGVVVVTAQGDEGPRGITVSSFTSVCLDPDIVLICIMQASRAHDAIAGGAFTVNVLAEDQAAVSDHFASSKLTSEEQFRDYSYPKLEGCVGYLECDVVGRTTQGDHTVFFGEVRNAELGRQTKPLVFSARQYWDLGKVVYER